MAPFLKAWQAAKAAPRSCSDDGLPRLGPLPLLISYFVLGFTVDGFEGSGLFLRGGFHGTFRVFLPVLTNEVGVAHGLLVMPS